MAEYYFLQSNLSLEIPFLQTNHYLIVLTDWKATDETKSKEKHVESLQLELVT